MRKSLILKIIVPLMVFLPLLTVSAFAYSFSEFPTIENFSEFNYHVIIKSVDTDKIYYLADNYSFFAMESVEDVFYGFGVWDMNFTQTYENDIYLFDSGNWTKLLNTDIFYYSFRVLCANKDVPVIESGLGIEVFSANSNVMLVNYLQNIDRRLERNLLTQENYQTLFCVLGIITGLLIGVIYALSWKWGTKYV